MEIIIAAGLYRNFSLYIATFSCSKSQKRLIRGFVIQSCQCFVYLCHLTMKNKKHAGVIFSLKNKRTHCEDSKMNQMIPMIVVENQNDKNSLKKGDPT